VLNFEFIDLHFTAMCVAQTHSAWKDP